MSETDNNKHTKELEDRLQIILESSDSLVYEWDIATGRVEWFGKIDESLGYNSEEFPRTVEARYNVIHHNDRRRVMEAVDRHLKMRRPYIEEYRIVRKNGEIRYWSDHGSAVLDNENKPYKWIGINSDITVSRNALHTFEKAYKTTRDIIEHAPFGIYVVNQKGNIDYVNPVMLQMSGDTYVQFMAFNIFEHRAYKEVGLLTLIKEGLKGKYFRLDSVRYTSHATKETTIRNFIGIPMDAQGEKKLLMIVEDITERKITEEKLKKSEEIRTANEQLRRMYEMQREFTSTVSHELRTPLSSMKIAVDKIMRGITGKINEDQRKHLKIAQSNMDRLSCLINDVLDLSKLEFGKERLDLENCDINNLIREVVSIQIDVAKGKGLYLKTKLDSEIPLIKASRDKLNQVMVNLIDNAIKFTDKGGITISSTNDPLNSSVKICVSDTGPGISNEDISRLFEKFQQLGNAAERKTGGTGLGLAICKEVISQHSGKIWVESEVNKGSDFLILLPVKYSDETIEETQEKKT